MTIRLLRICLRANLSLCQQFHRVELLSLSSASSSASSHGATLGKHQWLVGE